MPTITKVTRKAGIRYRAQVRIKHAGEVVHSEARTFTTKAAARRWGLDREATLKAPGGVAAFKAEQVTVGKVIADYLKSDGKTFGRTKRRHLEMLCRFELADTPLARLTTERLLDHVRWRNQHASSVTAGNDLIWLKSALEHAVIAGGYHFDLSILENARKAGIRLRLIGRARSRDRRPTADELLRITRWFAQSRRMKLPMVDIIEFAIASARREGEITRLLWADLNEAKHTCLLRDAKDPRGSRGNHMTFALTRDAMAIIKRQPTTKPQIFPYNESSIGTAWTRACKMLGISDLRFHDLRHEATSRLFEAGYQIHEVQQFTLHRQWSTLQRYTQLRPEDISGR